MKALRYLAPNVVKTEDIEQPVCAAGEVLILLVRPTRGKDRMPTGLATGRKSARMDDLCWLQNSEK